MMLRIFGISCALLLAVPAAAQNPFLAPVISGAATTVDSLVAGDWDGDGDADLAAVGLSSVLSISLRQAGGLGPATPVVFPSGGIQLRAGDLDQDGDLDLVCRDQVFQNPSALFIVSTNNGAGGFSPGVQVGASSNLLDFDLGDLDQDGDLDLVALLDIPSGSGENLALLANGGNANFGAPSNLFPGLGLACTALAVGDLDGNGSPDVALAGSAGGFSWINNGVGGASGGSPFAINAGLGPVVRLHLGDVDGDGDLDLVVAQTLPFPGGTSLGLYRGDGIGNFASREALPSTGLETKAEELADIDGDGDLDLVVLSAQIGMISVFWNDGYGSFPGVINSSSGSPNAKALVVADIDGDGDFDLGVGNGVEATHGVLDNHPPTLTPLVPLAPGQLGSLLVESSVDPGRTFVCGFALGSLPGIPLPDGRRIPINHDTVLDFVFTPANGIFTDPIGVLDLSGQATVHVAVPAIPSLSGLVLHAAFAVLPAPVGSVVGSISADPLALPIL